MSRLASFLVLLLPIPGLAVVGEHAMIASEHRLASEAGIEILKRGGNALDAAVATALTVCVVNPSSCGIGGGGFMVIYDRKAGTTYALDYRETAPHAASRDMFIRDGKALPELSLAGGLAVATPGEVAGLLVAHRRFGRLPLPTVMAPAIEIARSGFSIEPHLAQAIAKSADRIRLRPEIAAILLKSDGSAPVAGEILQQAALADTLERVSRMGRAGFYDGPVAAAIEKSVQSADGILTVNDLRSYRPVWRKPVRARFGGVDVYSMPPPSSGGGVLVQILRTIDRDDLPALELGSPTYIHLLAEAMQFGFAERAASYGDPDFVRVPLAQFLAPKHTRSLRGRIHAARTFPPEYYGRTDGSRDHGTSHLSVVDPEGNAVACTTTINTSFGSLVVAEGTGVILNNEMDDFSAQPGVPNAYGLIGNEANAIAPSKRPLSSMTPTIVLRGRDVVAVAGASGGPFIITSTLQTLLNAVVFDMDADSAVSAARFHHQWQPPVLLTEVGIDRGARATLQRLGHKVSDISGIGAVQMIRRRADGYLEGAADPRKGGAAVAW